MIPSICPPERVACGRKFRYGRRAALETGRISYHNQANIPKLKK
jgi:hypothetical protein